MALLWITICSLLFLALLSRWLQEQVIAYVSKHGLEWELSHEARV